MQVFHIRGFSGILLLVLAIVAAAAVLLALPASFMMVLWNTLVYEGLKGPEIDIYQGFLLWGAIAVLIKVVFQPKIQLQFQQMKPAGKNAKAAKLEKTEDKSTVEESPAKLDNQQNEG